MGLPDDAAKINTIIATLGVAIIVTARALGLAMAFAIVAARSFNKIAISIGTKIHRILPVAVTVDMFFKGFDAHCILLITGD